MTTVQIAPEAPGAPVSVAATGFRLAARRFSHNTLAVIGLVVIVVIVRLRPRVVRMRPPGR